MRQKNWKEAQVGEEFEPVKYVITREMVVRHADDIDDHNPWYLEKPPSDEPIAHPSIITGNYVLLFSTKFPQEGVMHTAAEHEYFAPIPVNKPLTIRGKIAERYIKRGREYVVLEHVTTDENGNVIVRSRDTLLIL